MIDLDELEKLTWSDWIDVDGRVIDAREAIKELIERVRRAENARDGWASNAMEYANAITGAEVLLARIAEAAKLHRPVDGIHGRLVCSHRHCVDDSQDQCAWPCETAIALGLNEGSET